MQRSVFRFGWLGICPLRLPDGPDAAMDAADAKKTFGPAMRRTTPRRAAWVAAVAALLFAGCAVVDPVTPGPGGSALRWTAVAPGVDLAQAAPWPDSVVHVVRIDLQQPALRLAVTPHGERGAALDTMPSANAAIVAINASFFDRQFDARGWTVSDGQVWPRPLSLTASPLFACDRVQRCRIHFDVPEMPAAEWFSVVAGTPWLVRGGVARSDSDDATCANLCAREHPRTAVGLDASRRHLWLVLAEGRRPPVAGVRLAPLSSWLRGLGIHDAINLDGGGSSALFVSGRSVMARPANEPQQRRIANGLLVLPVPAP